MTETIATMRWRALDRDGEDKWEDLAAFDAASSVPSKKITNLCFVSVHFSRVHFLSIFCPLR